MKTIFLIALGGASGAVFRFLLSKKIQCFFGLSFPIGTLFVNFIGSFLIGFLGCLLFDRAGGFAMSLRAFFMIGMLGGFTTFSSFSYETVDLWENHELFKASTYIIFSVALCLIATWFGSIIGRKL